MRVADHVEELDDVGAAAEVLENLDFAFDLLLLDGLEYLDDAFAVIGHVDALKDLRVLPATDLPNHLVVLLLAPRHHERLIVPVLACVGPHIRARASTRPAVARETL